MKRTIFLNALALLISAGIAAQSTNQTQNQTQVQNQTQLQTSAQTQDPIRFQDRTRSQLQIRTKDQLRAQSNFQARRTPGINAAARSNMMNRNMKMSSSSFAYRR